MLFAAFDKKTLLSLLLNVFDTKYIQKNLPAISFVLLNFTLACLGCLQMLKEVWILITLDQVRSLTTSVLLNLLLGLRDGCP